MQVEEKKSLQIINDDNELLQKLPECLSKHIEIYENIHKDIDSYDHLSISHFRHTNENNESYTKQLVSISTEFVNTVSRLKNNYITLTARYAAHKDARERAAEVNQEKQKVSNFDLFVS